MKRSLFYLPCLLAVALAGCEDPTKDTGTGGNSATGDATISDDTYNNSGDFLEQWDAYTTGDMKVITLTWSASSVDISGTCDGVTVTADGTDVTVVSTAKKVQYVLSGTCSDGSFKVYSDKKFVLQLNGITLNNPSGPAINIQKGKTAEDDGGYPHKAVYVLVTDGTTNTLTDGTYAQEVTVDGVEEDQKACFFSEGQLIFSGAGTLNVTGNNRHAVRSDDYIRLRSSVTMNITAKGEDGINGKDYLIVDGGTYTINVSADKGKGLKSDTILIAGGSTNITCTSSSAEGIEADYLTINDGLIECLAKDDGINADKSIVINGGYIYTRGTNNDGLDSNGTITINGGVIVAVGTQVPEEGIDCDQNTFTITGGIILGIGGASSTPTSSTCTQPSVLYGASCTAGTRLSLLDADGNIVLSYVPETTLTQMTLLLSSPSLATGSTYTFVSGGTYTAGTASDAISFHNLTNAGTLTSPTTLTTATLSSVVTMVGNVSNGGGGGNPGGNPGGGPGGGGRPGGR